MMSKFIIIYAVLFFIVPMTMISIMYILIGIKLWRSQDKLNRAYRAENNLLKKKSLKKRIASLFSSSTSKTSKNNDEKLNQRENSLIYDDNEDAEDDENKNYSSSAKQYTEVTNSTVSDRVPKELEQISERAKQSRRDVVKMLCKFKKIESF